MKCLIDLHLHLDGSLSLKAVKSLAKMQGICLNEIDEEILKKLKVDEGCRDLNEYLTKFDFPLTLLQSEMAIEFAVSNLLKELEEQGLIYAEIRFAPQLHTRKGLSQEQVINAAIKGLIGSQVKANLILCCMRGNTNQKENEETVILAEKYLGKGVCAIDLAGAEALFKTHEFADLFALARQKNIPFTIHAGEADGTESIQKALEFGAKRIGHGVRSYESDPLLNELSEKGITLELCPTSNLDTDIFKHITEYPIRKFLEKGVKITINTDNMTVSDTTVLKELKLIKNAFSLDDLQIRNMLLNSVNASFTDEKTKSELTEKIYKEYK